MSDSKVTRRQLLGGALTTAALAIVPRRALGGPDQKTPSDSLGAALVGCGGRGRGTFGGLGSNVRKLAVCEVEQGRLAGAVRWASPDGQGYTDFRRVMDRKDIDAVAIGTPPHWHALISIAAMQSGKDVLCEKPLTRFIAEGRAVVEAETRYGRILQVGTFARYGRIRNRGSIMTHKLLASGLLKKSPVVHIKRGGLKVKQWSGLVNPTPQPVPKTIDWDMYCGPSPLRPFHPHRHGGTHRGYWDYEGGGLADMGQHHFDPEQWVHAKDATSPVEIEAHAPPAHPLACGMWGWVELTYADGTVFVMDSTEWGEGYNRKQSRGVGLSDLSEEDQKKILATPDPKPWPSFPEAVRTREKTGGCGEAAHRSACILHLANIAIRVGRKIKYDPVKEQIIGDDEANRLVYQPMRAPWHLPV
ncbi:MAG: Gfo/Idh/MocA family oxidoreductase [Candidatus Brocadiae bacterium]|nr:Gfo/Idh/MocA family oxidoreductase [Candidatus Brocadiia bacterium]